MIISLSTVSAIDDENILELNEENLEKDVLSNCNEDIFENSVDNSVDSSVENSYSIYIGSNDNPSNANGDEDNPFTTLEDACISSDGKDNVTLMIYEGTYTIGNKSSLTFNTKNLKIQAINGPVVFKSLYNGDSSEYENYELAISLKNTQSSCLFSNITFDLSECKIPFWDGYFSTFVGNNVNLTYDNCIFKGFSCDEEGVGACILPYVRGDAQDVSYSNIVFNKCFFVDSNSFTLAGALEGSSLIFNYCIFESNFDSFAYMYPNSILFNRVWFGNNIVPNFAKDCENSPESIINYAKFDIIENYLGNNNYEIIGNLIWDDATTEGIENLPAMTVSLTSTGGTLESNTATLENGTFKVRYTSENPQNTITATLDSAVVNLNFATINMEASANPITYGADQIITVTLPEAMDGTITITVNNKTYTQPIFAEQIIPYQITGEILKEGNYTVNVKFTSEDGHSHGSTMCYLNVSKVSEYEFNATDIPTTVNVGDSIDITINLPEGVNGTATVKVGDNTPKEYVINKSSTVITIDDFVEGDNIINITFNGDNKYTPKTINYTINAVIPAIDSNIVVGNDGDVVIVTLTANGNPIGGAILNYTTSSGINGSNMTDANGQIKISGLTGEFTISVTYEGNASYNANTTSKLLNFTKSSQNPTAGNKTNNSTSGSSSGTSSGTTKTPTKTTKIATKITAKKAIFKAKKKTKKYTITLKAGKKPVKKVKVTIKVGKKTYTAKTNAKGKATFNLKKLTKKGKYTAIIKFKGNKTYKAISKKVKITVKK